VRDVTENGRKIGLSFDEGRKLLKEGKVREEKAGRAEAPPGSKE
jgi:hypothetical protein